MYHLLHIPVPTHGAPSALGSPTSPATSFSTPYLTSTASHFIASAPCGYLIAMHVLRLPHYVVMFLRVRTHHSISCPLCLVLCLSQNGHTMDRWQVDE